jgi:hypothetical protein
MLTRKIAACLFLCLLLIVGSVHNSYADSAEVLPKGISRGDLEYSYYFPIDENLTRMVMWKISLKIIIRV